MNISCSLKGTPHHSSPKGMIFSGVLGSQFISFPLLTNGLQFHLFPGDNDSGFSGYRLISVKLTDCSIYIRFYWREGWEEATGSKVMQQNFSMAIMVTRKCLRDPYPGSSLINSPVVDENGYREMDTTSRNSSPRLLYVYLQQQAGSPNPWVFKSTPSFSFIERRVNVLAIGLKSLLWYGSRIKNKAVVGPSIFRVILNWLHTETT